MAIKNGMASRTSSLAEQGEDFETVIEELADETKTADAKRVQIMETKPVPQVPEEKDANKKP